MALDALNDNAREHLLKIYGGSAAEVQRYADEFSRRWIGCFPEDKGDDQKIGVLFYNAAIRHGDKIMGFFENEARL